MNISKTIVGIDIARRVFQSHRVEQETGQMVSLQLKRDMNRALCQSPAVLDWHGVLWRLLALGQATDADGA